MLSRWFPWIHAAVAELYPVIPCEHVIPAEAFVTHRVSTPHTVPLLILESSFSVGRSGVLQHLGCTWRGICDSPKDTHERGD